MCCGNSGTEGETGETYFALMVEPMKIGYVDLSVEKREVKENAIEDLTFTFSLSDNYPIGKNCIVNIKWLNSIWIPSVIILNNK